MKRFRMAATGKTGEVWLYDVIGDSWDGTTAKGFAEDLKALGAVDTLRVYINSPGGSVFDGVAIHNQLRRHRARKEVVIDGIAASIASVVAMAGDEIAIASNGMMMIHNPWTFAAGFASDLRKTADTLDTIRETLLATYVARTGRASAEIGAMMDEETWMDGMETVAQGFADRVIDAVDIAALAGLDLGPFGYKKAPTFAVPPHQNRTPHPKLTLARAKLARVSRDHAAAPAAR